jgi:TonB family protein
MMKIAVLALALLAGDALGQERREPIRVGSNIQESKLIHKVDPVYPDSAKMARVSGVVILQVTVGVEGNVLEAQVLRGHPLLDQAALEAVRQWRYSPTMLNGAVVPVIATVSLRFHPGGVLSVQMSGDGALKDGRGELAGAELLARIGELHPLVVFSPNPRVPHARNEEAVRALRAAGAEAIDVSGLYALVDDRLYCFPSPSDQAPVLEFDRDRVTALARAAGLRGPLAQLLVSDSGQVTGLVRGGRLTPEIESELRAARVVTPGRRGGDSVPMVAIVTVE